MSQQQLTDTPNNQASLTVSSGVLLAIGILLLGSLLATGADVFVKLFTTSSGIYQYLFLRQLVLAFCLAPLFFIQPKEQRVLNAARIQTLRANLIAIGGACVFIALTELSLATANVLFYASPVITLLLAAWWFKEKLHTHRIINIVCCFVGVIVALRPDSGGLGIFAGLAAAVCIACHTLLVRFIPKSTNHIGIMFWSAILSLPLIFILSLLDWQPISWEMLYLVAGTAFCVAGYQLACIVAYRRVEAGAIAVIEYSGLVFAALFGWWMFNEALELWTAIGMALIILPIIFQTVLEYRKNKRQATSQAASDSTDKEHHPEFEQVRP